MQLLRCKAHKACQLAGRYPLPNTGLLGIQGLALADRTATFYLVRGVRT